MAINYATFIGYNIVWRAVMGIVNCDVTVVEFAKMKSLVWRVMVDGVVGFSMGFQYVFGIYVKTSEIFEFVWIVGNVVGVELLTIVEFGCGSGEKLVVLVEVLQVVGGLVWVYIIDISL